MKNAAELLGGMPDDLAEALAHLAGLPGPHLVVCPLSVVRNWESETAKFAPFLRVMVHHGTGRADNAEGARQAVADHQHDHGANHGEHDLGLNHDDLAAALTAATRPKSQGGSQDGRQRQPHEHHFYFTGSDQRERFGKRSGLHGCAGFYYRTVRFRRHP